MPDGFWQQMLYPVEGDSAIAELYFGEEPWATVRLTKIDLEAEGEARISEARYVAELQPQPDGAPWRFDLLEMESELAAAREHLAENERGRVPLEGDGDLTEAGAALDKASADEIVRMVEAGLRSLPRRSRWLWRLRFRRLL